MRKYYIFALLVFFMLVVQLLVFGVLVIRHDNDVLAFKITEEKFFFAVDSSVSNFLSRAFSNSATNRSTVVKSTENLPQIVHVDDLSTWVGPYASGCIIDGTRYNVGDYTDYGLIRLIDSGKVYCVSSNRVYIVRGRVSGRSPERPKRVSDNAPPLDI